MTDLFLRVLNLSYSAIWLVLAVVLARLLLKKAPRRLICLLWALVALRLLFGGIEAPFSLLPSTELIPPESLFDQSPAIHSGISGIDNAVNPIYSESLRPTPGASVNPLQVWLAVLANLWVLGMVAMSAWALLSCRRVRKQIRESIPDGEVWLCDRISSPFIFGLFRPKIYLPSDLPQATRTHVIAHEQAHLRRRDHWWKPLGFGLLTVNWFNPALWLAYVLLCRDIELACDERVIQRFTAEEKKAYSAALLRCSANSRRITACPLAFGEVGVKQRIRSVLTYKKPAFWVILATVIISIALGAGLLTNPPETPSELRVNGVLYVHTDTFDSYLPTSDSIGTLRSILHNTSNHPTEDFQATNLDETLAGCPLYPDGSNLYLQKFDGSTLLFQRIPPNDFLSRELSKELDYLLCAESGDTYEWKSLHGAEKESLTKLLESISGAEFTPISESQALNYDFSIDFMLEDGLTCSFNLRLSADDVWTLHFWDAELGNNYWQFTSEVLSDWALPYLHPEQQRTDFPTTYESPLGITLSLQNLTPNGATLICTQDGTPWDIITTGSPWNLEQQTDEGWITLMPESTVWTAIAYGVNLNAETRFNLNWNQLVGSLEPGHYRVSKTFTGERRPPFTLGIEGETSSETCYAEFDIADGFSPALHQAIQDSWTAYDSMPPMMQLASSTLPGSCTRDFDRWEDVEQFVGVTIPNPLETLDHLEKGNWAAAPEGYNDGSRFHVTFQGTREGQVQQLTVVAGYRLNDLRMTMSAQLCGDLPISPPGETVFSPNSGEGYEARTGMLTCGNIQYTLRVLGDPGTGDRVSELLQELRSYFEDLPTA